MVHISLCNIQLFVASYFFLSFILKKGTDQNREDRDTTVKQSAGLMEHSNHGHFCNPYALKGYEKLQGGVKKIILV